MLNYPSTIIIIYLKSNNYYICEARHIIHSVQLLHLYLNKYENASQTNYLH